MTADHSRDKDHKVVVVIANSSNDHKEIESRGRETSKDQGRRVTVTNNSDHRATEIRVEDHKTQETNKVQDLLRETETRVQNQNKIIDIKKEAVSKVRYSLFLFGYLMETQCRLSLSQPL